MRLIPLGWLEGFDQVMERMMEAAGQHNHPPPASETVIEGLPRLKLDQATLGMCKEVSYVVFSSSADPSHNRIDAGYQFLLQYLL